MSGRPFELRNGSTEPSAGRAGRRRALPTGRAVVGGFVVALAAVLAFAGWATTHRLPGARWVIADRSIAAGTTLSAADLTTTSLRLGDGAVADGAFRGSTAPIGRTLTVGVPAGALIMRSEIQPAATATTLRPVPVTVVPTDLVDLASGDLVDVLETSGTAPATHTGLVVRGAQVMSTVQPSNGLLGSSGQDVVTLGVASLSEVEAVVAAEHAGTVDLVVGEPGDGNGQGAGRA